MLDDPRLAGMFKSPVSTRNSRLDWLKRSNIGRMRMPGAVHTAGDLEIDRFKVPVFVKLGEHPGSTGWTRKLDALEVAGVVRMYKPCVCAGRSDKVNKLI